MPTTVQTPEPIKVPVIDYDLTLNCGRDFSFSLRPDDGDTATNDHAGDGALMLFFAKTKHHVVVAQKQIAVLSVRERLMAVLPNLTDKKTWQTTTTQPK